MKSRTLISVCQRPGWKPSHGDGTASVFGAGDSVTAMKYSSRSHALPARLVRGMTPRSLPVCLAIISSSFVGITHTDTRLSAAEMRAPFGPGSSRSSATPTQAEASQIRRRISAEFSPMPPVNTSASMPPSAAVSAPISFAARYTKYSTASLAAGSALASSVRMSLLRPEMPSRPDFL